MVVKELGAKDVPAELIDMFDAATDSHSIPQKKFKRTTDSSTFSDTARNKRQVPCCYDNPYTIVTLPSCSIPYTIINGTCCLAARPKPCYPGCMGRTTFCTAMYPDDLCPRQDETLNHQMKEQHQKSPSDLFNTQQTESGVNSTLNNEPSKTTNATLPSFLLENLPNKGVTSTTEHYAELQTNKTESANIQLGDIAEPRNNTVIVQVGEPSNSTTFNPYFCCVRNNTVCNMTGSPKPVCEICRCYCTPVKYSCCPDMLPAEDTSMYIAPISDSADYNPGSGCLCCNYSLMSGCSCPICNNMPVMPQTDTAGLMRGSGNGEGGNNIVSSINILARPSCADPCCNQNACMLSNSGNGNGGNKIMANANYINGGNLLCCSGNGKGGNCIRSMINVIGGESASVLSSGDGKMLKHLCDFMPVDDCCLLGCAPNITDSIPKITDDEFTTKSVGDPTMNKHSAITDPEPSNKIVGVGVEDSNFTIPVMKPINETVDIPANTPSTPQFHYPLPPTRVDTTVKTDGSNKPMSSMGTSEDKKIDKSNSAKRTPQIHYPLPPTRVNTTVETDGSNKPMSSMGTSEDKKIDKSNSAMGRPYTGTLLDDSMTEGAMTLISPEIGPCYPRGILTPVF